MWSESISAIRSSAAVPAGAGKSTLFRMITGQQTPDRGEIVIGPTVKLAFVDQSRESLDNTKTVFEDVSGGNDMLTLGKFQKPRS